MYTITPNGSVMKIQPTRSRPSRCQSWSPISARIRCASAEFSVLTSRNSQNLAARRPQHARQEREEEVHAHPASEVRPDDRPAVHDPEDQRREKAVDEPVAAGEQPLVRRRPRLAGQPALGDVADRREDRRRDPDGRAEHPRAEAGPGGHAPTLSRARRPRNLGSTVPGRPARRSRICRCGRTASGTMLWREGAPMSLRRLVVAGCRAAVPWATVFAQTPQTPGKAIDPISGTWTGDIGLTDDNRFPVTFELKFDGTSAISGHRQGPRDRAR